MDIDDAAECPFCLGRMQLDETDGESWMVCPNGCPTEFQISAPIPEVPALPARAAASSK